MPISIGGQTYSDDQVREFYANGGNERQFLEQAGMGGDPWAARDATLQARQIAGPGTMAGESGMQQYFKQYQQNNPNGAYANNYNAWAQDQNPTTLGAMRSGTYTGAAVSPKDYEPGGIYGPGSAAYGKPGYASGLGARGDGGGWGEAGGSSGGSDDGYADASGGGGGGGFGSGGFGGGGGGYGGSSSSSSGGQNPYLSQMADDIGRRSQQALGQGLQSIRSNSVATGGLGGSRQGVAEGAAIAGANDALTGNLANMYGTDWTNGQNRNLSYYGINTNAALTNQGQQQSFYTANRGQDLQALGLGAQLFGQGNAGLLGQGQGLYGVGNTQQQAPWSVINNANQAMSPYTGYGSSTTQTGPSTGGGIGGAIGGGLAGAQIGKNLGLGGWGTNSDGWASNNGSQNMYGYTGAN